MAAATIAEYLDGLEADRRAGVEATLDIVRTHLPAGCAEGMQYGMPSFFVPHSVYAYGYHCDPKQPVPFFSIASQKAAISIYLMGIYLDDQLRTQFEEGAAAAGLTLDMGKGCVRFKKPSQIPLQLIADVVASCPVDRFLAVYEAGIPAAVLKKRKPVS